MGTFAVAVAILLAAALPTMRAARVPDDETCSAKVLPATIQSRIKADFGSWKVQESQDLSSSARGRWVSMKPLGCPGITAGQFESTDETYVVLLVPSAHSDTAYRLVAFSRVGDGPYRGSVIEEWDGGGSSNFFVHKIQIKDYLSESWRRKLRVSATEGFLFADAGTAEYEIDVYFWSNGKYRHEFVDE